MLVYMLAGGGLPLIFEQGLGATFEGWRRRDALLKKGAAPVTKRMLELSRIAAADK